MTRKPHKTKKRPTARDLLKATPHQNVNIRVEPTDDGGLILTVPLRRPRWMVPPVTWLLPLRPERRFELDALGASVLNMCDGDSSVEQIIGRFAEGNGLSFREAQVSVVQFLKMLTQRGVIAIVAVGDS